MLSLYHANCYCSKLTVETMITFPVLICPFYSPWALVQSGARQESKHWVLFQLSLYLPYFNTCNKNHMPVDFNFWTRFLEHVIARYIVGWLPLRVTELERENMNSRWSIKETLLLLCLSVVSSSLQNHGLQHARLPCPSPSPGVCSNSCPLSWKC